MTILVFGKTGQVGRALEQDARTMCLSRTDADLMQPQSCADVIRRHAPTAVINAAAYTAVDKSEDDAEAAFTVNGVAPGAMAQACAALDIPFVSISTDYVFDGSGTRAWMVEDTPNPLGVYGKTKLAGETEIAQAGGVWAILRTSWVFSAHAPNFVLTMLRLGAERDTLRIVADQVGGPTPAQDIADACLMMVESLKQDPLQGGMYHFSGAPAVSWADFAREIFLQAEMDCAVEDISTTAYPTPATRPLNSRLDGSALQKAFGIQPPNWKSGLSTVLDQIKHEAKQ